MSSKQPQNVTDGLTAFAKICIGLESKSLTLLEQRFHVLRRNRVVRTKRPCNVLARTVLSMCHPRAQLQVRKGDRPSVLSSQWMVFCWRSGLCQFCFLLFQSQTFWLPPTPTPMSPIDFHMRSNTIPMKQVRLDVQLPTEHRKLIEVIHPSLNSPLTQFEFNNKN